MHEQAHIQTGYLLYGAYGPRNFNVWQTADSDGYRWLASLAGPLLSYAAMWTGLWMSRRYPGPGIALLFAGLPFARTLTAIVGGGDEKVILLFFSGGGALDPIQRLGLPLVVLVLAGLPVALALRRFRIPLVHLLLLLFLPLFMEFPLTHIAYNKLLERGIGSEVLFGGTPWLIQIHFMITAIAFWRLRKHLVLSPRANAVHEKEGSLSTTLLSMSN